MKRTPEELELHKRYEQQVCIFLLTHTWAEARVEFALSNPQISRIKSRNDICAIQNSYAETLQQWLIWADKHKRTKLYELLSLVAGANLF